MGRNRVAFAVAVAACIVLTPSDAAWGWGPGAHVRLGCDLLSNLWLLPAGIAAILARNSRYFLFGNVATDTVFAKRLSKIKQVCHHWATGLELLNAAETEAAKAFAYGYLAHLAADTVAHNKFLPRQMAVSRSTVSLGHLYWEVRADTLVGRGHWLRLRATLRGNYEEPERLLEDHLRQTALSFRTNLVIFRRMNLLACERGWRRSVQVLSRLSRFELSSSLVGSYWAESLDRAIDIVSRGPASVVMREDPCGNAALGYARAQRRQLRQMRRARMRLDHVVEEAAANHAPTSRRSLITGIPA